MVASPTCRTFLSGSEMAVPPNKNAEAIDHDDQRLTAIYLTAVQVDFRALLDRFERLSYRTRG